MIKIRKITNPYLVSNLRKLEKVKEIIRSQFSSISEKKIEEIENQLVDSLKH
ncbi:MAG: hypothetical protein MUP53_01260 [Bacteroidales bacterium]|nr:hypothetical protein [Bacteroidales bacterium]